MSLMNDHDELFIGKLLPIYSKYRASTHPSSATQIVCFPINS